jgi:hypothetical protein
MVMLDKAYRPPDHRGTTNVVGGTAVLPHLGLNAIGKRRTEMRFVRPPLTNLPAICASCTRLRTDS